jgi:hypothetical protein
MDTSGTRATGTSATCSTCPSHACERLTCGVGADGGLVFIASSEVNAESCSHVCDDLDEVTAHLSGLSLHELIYHTELVLDELPAGESSRFQLRHYCQDFRDTAGRIAFIKAVVDEGLVVMLRAPVPV